MKRQYFTAELKADIIFSETSATAGNHSSLSYLPGSAFLGFCASKLYDTFYKLGVSYHVFHNGAVRFSNAYPVSGDGCTTIPVPLSWHVEKGEKSNEKRELLTNNINNLLCISTEKLAKWKAEGKQPKQLREGYFSYTGFFELPKTEFRMKTAIDRSTGGRAVESQLFGYESLETGSLWYFFIDFDDAVSKDIQQQISNILSSVPIRIGKSRTAEYGVLEVTEKNHYNEAFYTPADSDGFVTFYCFSDIALKNRDTGAPTLHPDSAHFGLSGNTHFSPAKSFIRTRAYSPFNNKRKTNDLERHVICKGSVITFDCKEKFDIARVMEIQKSLEGGVGLYLHDGLGMVFTNPDFLLNDKFAPTKSVAYIAHLNQTPTTLPPSPLKNWIDQQVTKKDVEKKAIEYAEMWSSRLAIEMAKMRSRTPGKSQWAQLRGIAIRSKNIEDITKALFESDRALCTKGISCEKWRQKFNYEGTWKSFTDFLQDPVLSEAQNFADKPSQLSFAKKVLYLLGEKVAHKMNQEGL
jgi:CRISPR-associated protein Csx10